MISKELLSEVLNIENERIHRKVDRVCFPNDNTIAVMYYMKDGWLHFNIHELAHMCKEWATEKGYEIIETQFMIRAKRVGQEKWKIYEYPREMQDEGLYFNPSFTFKICQWILENKENN